MPTTAVHRAIRLAFLAVTTLGAIAGATRALIQDRQHTRAMRDQLAYLNQTGV